jgi:two-component system chemotaxis response regulator CheB
MRVLIAEDDPTSSFLLQRTLEKQGYQVIVAQDGQEALEYLEKEPYDAVLTDWMMPRMDGISLTRHIREKLHPSPLIIVITALVAPEAKTHALDSGADDYITKPYIPKDVITCLENLVSRREQPQPDLESKTPKRTFNITPLFPVVCLTANTGGPIALSRFFKAIDSTPEAAFLVILQAPLWALEMFAMRLQKQTRMRVQMVEDGITLHPSRIYIARKDQHVKVEPTTFRLCLTDEPPVNFCRPSADVLFESAVRAFGTYTVGITLSGIGKDGLVGLSAIAANGGLVLTQEPGAADAPYLPQAVSELGISKAILPLEALGKLCESEVANLVQALATTKRLTSV